MATNKRKEKAVQRINRHQKKGKTNNSDAGVGVDPAPDNRHKTLNPLENSVNELDEFLGELTSGDDEPFIIATQNTQNTQKAQNSPSFTVEEDSTIVVEGDEKDDSRTPSENSSDHVEGGKEKTEKKKTRREEGEVHEGDIDEEEINEGKKDEGKKRCRWSDERLLVLVRQVLHWKPTATGISNKLKAERWKKVCSTLRGNPLFNSGVSVESCKQQLRKTLNEGKALEREDARQTGLGDNGQYDDLQRTRIELTKTMVTEKEILDQTTSSQMAKKLTQGQQMKAVYESGQGGGSIQPLKMADSPSLSMAMADAGQHVQAMQGHLADVATMIRNKSSNSSTNEILSLLREELKEGRQLQMQMQSSLMELLKSWGPPRNNS